MSSANASKRATPNMKDTTSPLKALTPQSQSKSKGTPMSTTGLGTPTLIQGSGDSPERANKRARFSHEGYTGSDGGVKAEGLAPPSLGQVGRGMSGGWGGAVWVTDRVSELEAMYKECILAATLLLQYKSYAQRLGTDIKRIPLHLSQRLERAWSQYSSLRAHIEAYLLQCAQAANVTSPSKTLPTPSSLVPGLPPLPPTPSIPNTATTLLQTTPHPGRSGPVSLDKLLAADPARGLVGYEKGQVVFPGVPSDIAMPDPIPVPVDTVVEAEAKAEVMPISLPGIDYGTAQSTSEMQQGDGLGIGLGIGDMSGLADLGGMGGGMDLDSLGIAELSALINGDGDSVMGDQGMLGGGALNSQGQVGLGLSMGLGMSSESDNLLDSLNEYSQSQNQTSTMQGGSMLSQTQTTAPPPIDSAPSFSISQSTYTPQQPPPQAALQLEQPFVQPSQSTLQSFTPGLPQQKQQQSAPPQPPTQNFDFDFSTIDGTDGLDPMDGMADIDFNELAGMFGGSGRTTRAPSPVGGAGTTLPLSAPVQPMGASLYPTATGSNLPQSQSQLPAQDLGLALSNLYPLADDNTVPAQATAAFDSSLGGIDLDDFDFGGGDGEGGMPGVDGDEFESMFAEFK